MADQAANQNEILAPKVKDLFFDERGNWITSRYKVMKGGRGSLKTWGFGRVAVLLAASRKVRVLCAREYQNSIAESVHQTLETQIEALGLDRYFDINKTNIEVPHTGAEFIFAGLKSNPRSLKSKEGIDIVWIEEAESISKESWKNLTPTIRRGGSEIWAGYNPNLPTDPTSVMFGQDEGHPPPPRSRIITVNWRDNPWLSQELIEEKDYLAAVDPDAYQWIWEGKYRKNGAAQILKGKYTIEAFEPGKDWEGPFYGADWGFSQDPTTLVRLWIHQRKLYIEFEAYKVGCDIDQTPVLFDAVPGAREATIRADSARPETISYMQRHGYSGMTSVEKWEGSVEDGIAFLRQFEQIVIHQRCKHAADEALLYSFKVDKLTGDVLTDIVDKHNHIIDAIRYALQPMIRHVGTGLLQVMAEEFAKLQAAKGKQ
jgi:phage terminase large subunit